MTGSRERRRLVSITAAAPGWRAVYAIDPAADADLDSLPDDDMFCVLPVACFAVVEERWDREGSPEWEDALTGWEDSADQRVDAVILHEGRYLVWDDLEGGKPLQLLAPGEHPEAPPTANGSLRAMAKAHVLDKRARAARLRAVTPEEQP